MHKKLQNLFNIRLDDIPDDSFNEANSEANSVGDTLTNFRKMLRYLECNLFNVVEVKRFSDGTKNVFFLNHDLNSISLLDLQKLVNDLYLIHGPDDHGKGTFSTRDKEDFYSEDFYTLFGRGWNDTDKFKNPVNLSIDREIGTISLGLWGLTDAVVGQ